ncbi:hypothetical protein ACFPRL_24080 [Pseudoclavibacter helvolus]
MIGVVQAAVRSTERRVDVPAALDAAGTAWELGVSDKGEPLRRIGVSASAPEWRVLR